ncbi:MAG: hypothetical protein ABIP55_07010, partial [Tepidisphaeraceae bacterium]
MPAAVARLARWSAWTVSIRKTLSAFVLFLAASPIAWAAIIGAHDYSDPVKTLGWACSDTSAEPVRVHLYAEVDGALWFLDSQLADKRRDDLVAACGGTSHAFRFSDYATSAAGVALYGSQKSVGIRVFAHTPTGLQIITGHRETVSFAPVGIRDSGLRSGRWRTDLNNPSEGLAETPLLLGDCQFTTPFSDGYMSFSGGGPDATTHCRYGSLVFPSTNSASSGTVLPFDDYWVVIGNIEPALANPECVTGPPGQSRPFRAPGAGELFGIASLPDGEAGFPERRKMHLVLNSTNMTLCREHSYAIPYLSFGAQADRGNNGVITYLNAGGKTALRFAVTLMDIAESNPAFGVVAPGVKRYSQAHVLIEAIWGGRKRWLFLELLPDARREAGGADTGIDIHVRFNWHMVDSFIYPGADYVFKSASLLSEQCRAEAINVPALDRSLTYVNPATRNRSRIEYTLDLQATFDCLQRTGAWGLEPMPAHPVPVTGIHFGVEQDDRLYRDGAFTGVAVPNAVWIAVDGIRVD